MICRGMVVVCKTDEEHGCSAAFEGRGRKEATLLRKHLYRILPPHLRSSVAAFVETKQQHVQHGLTISARIGYPIPPTKWFATEDGLPNGFEDLLLPPEVIKDWLDERRRQMKMKPWWYWWLPDWDYWRPKR